MRSHNKNPFRTVLTLALLIATSAVFTAACSTGKKVVPREDAAVTADIDAQIAADAALSPYEIEVVTTDGVVRLSGGVPSESDRDGVEALAAATPGVRSVENYVQFGVQYPNAD